MSMVSTMDQSIAQTVMERVQSIVKIPLGKEKESELQLFIDNCIVRNEECPLYFLGIPCSDKLMRTAVHKLFKDDPQLSTFIDSDTQTVDGTSFVRLIAKHRRKEMHIPVVQVRNMISRTQTIIQNNDINRTASSEPLATRAGQLSAVYLVEGKHRHYECSDCIVQRT